MPDIFDMAQELDLQLTEQAIYNFQASNEHSSLSYSHCVDCGEEIPDNRRKAIQGCKRCIDCQEHLELYQNKR